MVMKGRGNKFNKRRILIIFLILTCSFGLLFTFFGIRYYLKKSELKGKIAFERNGNIYVLNLNARETEQLTEEGIYSSPKFSPDGKWILVGSKENYFVISDDGTQKLEIPIKPTIDGDFIYWFDNRKFLFFPIDFDKGL